MYTGTPAAMGMKILYNRKFKLGLGRIAESFIMYVGRLLTPDFCERKTAKATMEPPLLKCRWPRILVIARPWYVAQMKLPLVRGGSFMVEN